MEAVHPWSGSVGRGRFQFLLERVDQRGDLDEPDTAGRAFEGMEAPANLVPGLGRSVVPALLQVQDQRLDPVEQVGPFSQEDVAQLGVDRQRDWRRRRLECP